MKKQKIGERPRPLHQKVAFFLMKAGGLCLLAAGIYSLYSLATFWQLERRSAELPGLHLYSVQESNYTNAFSWYASYPKIDEPAFDTVVAKIANDAKGAFLARVNFQVKTKYPHDDLNVSYSVDSYNKNELQVALAVRRSIKGTASYVVTTVTYDRKRQKVSSITTEKNSPRAKSDTVSAGDAPTAQNSGADCDKQKCIALTFNDGPSPVTAQILDSLKSSSAKATFFEVGAQAKLYPRIARRTATEGHVIGNLGFNHLNMAAVPFSEMASDINRSEDAIKAASGIRPGLLRAAYGAITKDLAKRTGMPVIGWSFDARDDITGRPDAIYRNVMSKIRPGAVVVSRDTQQATADAYRRVIPDLVKKGYRLVTVPQLLDFKSDERPGLYGN